MIALGIVLFALTGRTETGKADAGIAAGTRTAIGIYREEVKSAEPGLRRLARDEGLHRAIASGSMGAAERRLRELAAPRVEAAELWSSRGTLQARIGSRAAIAAPGAEIVVR